MTNSPALISRPPVLTLAELSMIAELSEGSIRAVHQTVGAVSPGRQQDKEEGKHFDRLKCKIRQER